MQVLRGPYRLNNLAGDNMKISESDQELLRKAMEATGANELYEFLWACQSSRVIKAIREEIENTRRLNNPATENNDAIV
jgi:hypothetical protein